MIHKRDGFVIAFILLYATFFCATLLFNTPDETTSAAVTPVLGTSSLKFATNEAQPDLNQLLTMTNQSRAEIGADPLIVSEALTRVAQHRANDMSARNYFSHVSPEGKYYFSQDPMFEGVYSCENLVIDSGLDEQTYMRHWLASSSHKDCLQHDTLGRVGYGIAPVIHNHSRLNEGGSYIIVAIHAAP